MWLLFEIFGGVYRGRLFIWRLFGVITIIYRATPLRYCWGGDKMVILNFVSALFRSRAVPGWCLFALAGGGSIAGPCGRRLGERVA